MLTNDNGNGLHQIVVRRVGATAAEIAGKTFSLKVDSIRDPLKTLRQELAARRLDKKRRTRSELIADLTALAQAGWDLYSPVMEALEETLFAWKHQDQPFVIQVTRPDTSSFVLPWGWCYDIPLDSQKKPYDLCPMVEQWDDSKPLFTGVPRRCSHDHSNGNVLCPFGFIGLRHAIEQQARNDTPVIAIESAPRCDFVVAETQKADKPGALINHVKALRAIAAAAGPKVDLTEAKTREDVQRLLGGDVALVYFFCHGKRQNVIDPDTYLAVGNDEPITAHDFEGWLKVWRAKLNRWIWSDVRPLIFINACHSLAIEPKTFVTYLDAFITHGHAAGVIGTEVDVPQQLAMDVAEQFFSRLLARTHTVETALHEIRMDYLAWGNLFGLEYTPYCWADLHLK